MIGGGGFNPPPAGNSLDERKRQLLQWLAGRGATQAGFRGTAVGRMGAYGGKGPLPAMTYNPFFAQIAGRNENFDSALPYGLSSQAAAAVQQGAPGPGMGLSAPPGGFQIGAAQGGPPPGVGAPSVDQAPGLVQPHGGFAGHNLIGAGSVPPPLQPAFNQNLQSSQLPQLQPFYDPFAVNRAVGARGTFRE